MTTTLTISNDRDRDEELLIKKYTSKEETIDRLIEFIIPISNWDKFHKEICNISVRYGVIIRRVK